MTADEGTATAEVVKPVTCSECGKTRTTEPDYTPIQAIMGQPLGWYSGSDGELCPEDMVKLMEMGNRGYHYEAAKAE